MAEAETCFFFDLNTEPAGTRARTSERALAQAVWAYVSMLVGRQVALDELYITNLCNYFLPPPPKNAVVLIPQVQADNGLRELTSALASRLAPPRLIIAMSQQVLFHFVRTKFLAPSSGLDEFLHNSAPSPRIAQAGGYRARKNAAFLSVCGKVFQHDGVPVVPVLHISSAQRKPPRYRESMILAGKNIQELIKDA